MLVLIKLPLEDQSRGSTVELSAPQVFIPVLLLYLQRMIPSLLTVAILSLSPLQKLDIEGPLPSNKASLCLGPFGVSRCTVDSGYQDCLFVCSFGFCLIATS